MRSYAGHPKAWKIRSNLCLRTIWRIATSRDKRGVAVKGASKVFKHKALVQQAATCKDRQETRLQGNYQYIVV
jgi:hypothetical protein